MPSLFTTPYLYIYGLIVLFLLIILKLKLVQSFWKRKGIYQLKAEFFFGNTKGIFTQKKSWGDTFLDFHKEIKAKGLPYAGICMFNQPILVVTDLELIRRILMKDFEHFMSHGSYVNEEYEPLTGHLFNLEGQKWRNLRAKMTPTFTSRKMKMMFHTFVNCTDGLVEVLGKYAKSNTMVDIKEILARFTTDIIGSCAFGIDCNSLKNPESEFRKNGKRLVDVTLREVLFYVACNLLPKNIIGVLGLKNIPYSATRFFTDMVKQTVEYREKNNICRKDAMHLLLQLKNHGKVTDEENVVFNTSDSKSAITMDELTSQCLLFFIAGYETSSTTMTFTLFELARNPDIQEKLRNEINTVLKNHDNQLTYDAGMEMKYLDNVIYEALRKYPPLPVVIRECTKEYTLPGTNIILKKGTKVQISALGLQMDPEFYPNPENFDPDRFSKENKQHIHPLTWLPFGEGPRQCLGLRFGMLQTKVGVATIIKNYKITVNSKTIVPLEMDPAYFFYSAKGDIWLNVEKL